MSDHDPKAAARQLLIDAVKQRDLIMKDLEKLAGLDYAKALGGLNQRRATLDLHVWTITVITSIFPELKTEVEINETA